jgi:hypothetical protein
VEDSKAEVFLEWIKIMVSVEEGTALTEAVRCNQTVDGLPNRMAVGSEGTIVLCRGDSQGLSSSLEHLEFGQVTPYAREGCVSTDSLQYLAQNEIG